MDDPCRSGTRIFKKSTPNNKLTIYLGKRDYIDHLSYVDPIEGVILVDPEYVKGRKIYVHLLGAFRYCREEMDLFGLNCYRDIYLSTQQVYPHTQSNNDFGEKVIRQNNASTTVNGREPSSSSMHTSRLQERLIRKLGNNSYPFCFQLPPYSAASVSLLLNPSDSKKPCRIDYELKAYFGEILDDKPQKRSSVRMVIRKLTYAPQEPGPQPSIEVIRDFLMSLGSLRAEVSLDKQKYYHGETLSVNVLVDNNSNKTIKRIKILVRQYTRICLHNTMNYKCTVAELQSEEGFPINPSQTGWCKVYRICPLLSGNRDKVGVAMDGDLKHEDTNLASSTIDPPNSATSNPAGIHVQYKVKVRLILGFGASDICLQLPFILTHPNPNGPDGVKSDSDPLVLVEDVGHEDDQQVTLSQPSSPTSGAPSVLVTDTNGGTGTTHSQLASNGRQTASGPDNHALPVKSVSNWSASLDATTLPARTTELRSDVHLPEFGVCHINSLSSTPELFDQITSTSKQTTTSSTMNHMPRHCNAQRPLLVHPLARHPVGIRNTTLLHGNNDDDMIFEDFARLRAAHPAVDRQHHPSSVCGK